MITRLIKQTLPEANYKYADIDNNEQLLNALEWHWVNGNSPMSTPYWADKIGHKNLDNFIYALSEAGWLISKANARAKWGEFYLSQAMIDKHLTREKQLAYRIKIRTRKYAMRYVDNQATDLVKTASGVRPTGLIRKGFAKCSNQPFKLDVAPLVKYYDAVLANLQKSMDKIMVKYPTIKVNQANYKEISRELLDYYIFNEGNIYNLEGNISDSRGRAIYNGIRRVGNPISNKDFRACLVVPQGKIISRSNKEALREIYLFIAELTGCKSKSWTTKALAGQSAYHRKELHDLDLTSEADRKELHENIWLERIYAKLDELNEAGSVYWDIPIEIDATMSLAQVVGVLTNDARLLDRTNVINETTLLDAWYVEGVPRLHTKTVGTPVFYGSAQSATKLLRGKKLMAIQQLHEQCRLEHRDPTPEEIKQAKATDSTHIKILSKEFNKGAFGIIKGFKDFLIQHSNVETPTIDMKIWDDQFEVEVNKFKPVGAKTNAYSIWNSETKRQVIFLNHTVEVVPDYDRFRLYYPTGLVHNLDSQLMNKTLENLDEWAIAIHDAILVLPNSQARTKYVEQLEILRANRHQILATYRQSIGATSKGADIAWAKLMDKTEQLCSAVPFASSALK